MLDTTRNDIAVANREDVGDTITCIDDCASHVLNVRQVSSWLGFSLLIIWILVRHLRVKSKGCLHANE